MTNVEPWLSGSLTEIDPVRRAVLHALELAEEDVEKWTGGLNEAEMFARPSGLPPVAFQLRHMVRSLDRLLTYAEGQQLSGEQIAVLKSELDAGSVAEVFAEFLAGIKRAKERVLSIAPETFVESRGVGKKMLPTTVAGLLVHCADHTQRHVGQMVTTVKVIRADS